MHSGRVLIAAIEDADAKKAAPEEVHKKRVRAPSKAWMPPQISYTLKALVIAGGI